MIDATCATGTVTVAEAVELVQVPVLGAVFTGATTGANCGMTCILKMVPGGVLVAVRVTVIGFVVPGGRKTSGVAYAPVGEAGTEMPPTVVILRVGRLVRAGVLAAVTGPGEVTSEGDGLVVLKIGNEKASTRIRPAPAGPGQPTVLPNA